MSHKLYKFYPNYEHAEAFLDGKILFRSLAYFRDIENDNVRGDAAEGSVTCRPTNGLLVTNHSNGTSHLAKSFDAIVNPEEIFIFCVSTSKTKDIEERFKAVACVEVNNVPAFFHRVEAALPHANFHGKKYNARIGHPVVYYNPTDKMGVKWSQPGLIATSKRDIYAWQQEYRLIFSFTEALEFEKANLRLVYSDPIQAQQNVTEHKSYLVEAGTLQDICKLHSL